MARLGSRREEVICATLLLLDTLSKKCEVITLGALPGGERRGVEGSVCGGKGGVEGRGGRKGRREEHDTFGFGRMRRTCQCLWPMERGHDVSS